MGQIRPDKDGAMQGLAEVQATQTQYPWWMAQTTVAVAKNAKYNRYKSATYLWKISGVLNFSDAWYY